MYPHRYWPKTYFPYRYWPAGTATRPLVRDSLGFNWLHDDAVNFRWTQGDVIDFWE